jgi:hypothetical protein
MTANPIPGFSDQRYFHVALMSPRMRDFDTKWIWNNLGKGCKICPGRHKRAVFQGGAVEFRVAEESPLFAGSVAGREALATSKRLTECGYDIFGGSVGPLVMMGTGYSALTRVLVSRLISRGLLSKAWFLIPQLDDIVGSCRGAEDVGAPMRFTITGFSAFLPGVKELRLLRLGGTDVFGSGLVEEIERWLEARSSEKPMLGQDAPGKELDPLLYQTIRVKAVGNLSGAAVSVSLVGDGGCKLWLRKNAVNLPEFAGAISTLYKSGRFDTSAEPPSWSEDSEI